MTRHNPAAALRDSPTAAPLPAEEGATAGQHLLDLADECERVIIPSRELDLSIDCEVRPSEWSAKVRETKNPGHPVDYFDEDELPRYTASLDAAMTLVPERWEVGLETSVGGHAYAGLTNTAEDADGWRREARNPSLALALCAAALRARAAQ